MGSCNKSALTNIGNYYFWIRWDEIAQMRIFAPVNPKIIDIR